MSEPAASDRRIGVVGIGTLGTTLVQLGVDVGHEVVAVHRPGSDKHAVAHDAIERSVRREVDRGRMSEDRAAEALDSLVLTDDFAALAGCGVVLEATHEHLVDKQAVVRNIEQEVAADTIIASSTSSLPAAALGADAAHPERVVVAHYIWPANRMPVVEVAVPDVITPAIAARFDAFLTGQGKEQLRVSDTLGFYVTRVLYIYWSRMASLLASGVTPDEIDTAMQGAGWRMGPCRLIDGTGIESVLRIFDVVRPSLGDRADDMNRLRPLVEACIVGGATGVGLYDHRGSEPVANDDACRRVVPNGSQAPATAKELVTYLEDAFVAETERCLDEGVIASWEQAALGVDGAYGFPGGLLSRSSSSRC